MGVVVVFVVCVAGAGGFAGVVVGFTGGVGVVVAGAGGVAGAGVGI